MPNAPGARDGNAVDRGKQRIFILNLHGIGARKRELPASEQRVWIAGPVFEALLDFVQARSDVELTFDDANESDFTIALPALRARGLKARFFLVADRIGQPAFLSHAQVERLLNAGMALGSHGMRHRPWVGLDMHELHEELVEARSRLENGFGVKVEQASCPFGSYDRRILRALRQAQYRHVFTSDGGAARAGSFLLPRNSVGETWDLRAIQAMISAPPSALKSLVRNLKLWFKRCR
jgi:peptidoglycan/xylan/chitin deacetylase (PgdA/CDA1 family)